MKDDEKVLTWLHSYQKHARTDRHVRGTPNIYVFVFAPRGCHAADFLFRGSQIAKRTFPVDFVEKAICL